MNINTRFQSYIIDGLSEQLEKLLEIFKLDINYIPIKSYLSGSSAVKLYHRESIATFNDLDIYIQKDITHKEISRLVENLFNGGYVNKISTKKISNKLIKALNDDNSNIYQNHEYFSLNGYINSIISLENQDGKKIDIIIIRYDIESLLLKTFDLDVVKNYIQLVKYNNIVRILNKEAIDTFKATITMKHFTDRILNNIYEFNNFIKRYKKYTSRGYDIFIDNTPLDKVLFLKIIKIILSSINKNYLRLESKYSKYKLIDIVVNDNLDKLIEIKLKSKEHYHVAYMSDLNKPDCFLIDLFTIFKYEFRQNKKMVNGIIQLVKNNRPGIFSNIEEQIKENYITIGIIFAVVVITSIK